MKSKSDIRSQSYNLAAIRELLRAAFTAEELRRFCQDHPTFRPILDEFGPGYSLNDMVDRVITYCDKHVLHTPLLSAIEAYNPAQYNRYKLRLHSAALSPRAEARQSPRPVRLLVGLLAVSVTAVIVAAMGFQFLKSDSELFSSLFSHQLTPTAQVRYQDLETPTRIPAHTSAATPQPTQTRTPTVLPTKTQITTPTLPETAAELLERYRAGEVDFRGASLPGVDLNGANLSFIQLTDADLTGADLRRADLSYADLTGAWLDGADLIGADLRWANLRYASVNEQTQMDAKWMQVWEITTHGAAGRDLAGADFAWANLNELDLAGVNLAGANLAGADLLQGDLRGADLSGAILTGTVLIEAQLLEANLSEAGLSGALMRGADLTGAQLIRADLSGASLHEANMARADLSEADLCGAELYGADLTDTILHSADLRGVNMLGATVTDVQLGEAAVLDGLILPYGMSYRSGFQSDGKVFYRDCQNETPPYYIVINDSVERLYPARPGTGCEPITLAHPECQDVSAPECNHFDVESEVCRFLPTPPWPEIVIVYEICIGCESDADGWAFRVRELDGAGACPISSENPDWYNLPPPGVMPGNLTDGEPMYLESCEVRSPPYYVVINDSVERPFAEQDGSGCQPITLRHPNCRFTDSPDCASIDVEAEVCQFLPWPSTESEVILYEICLDCAFDWPFGSVFRERLLDPDGRCPTNPPDSGWLPGLPFGMVREIRSAPRNQGEGAVPRPQWLLVSR